MKTTCPSTVRRNTKQDRLVIIQIMNFINSWRRKIDKVKNRKIYRYGKNVQSTLNLTVKEQYSVSEWMGEASSSTGNVLDDNIAIEKQVKLVAFKAVGSRRERTSARNVSCDRTRLRRNETRNGDDDDGSPVSVHNRNIAMASKEKQKRTRETFSETDDVARSLRKPLKRLNSHGEEFRDVYKKINWQDWTIAEPTRSYNTYNGNTYKRPNLDIIKTPDILIEEVQSPTSDVFESPHKELTLERLSRMYLDLEDDSVSTSSESQDNKENTESELQVPKRYSGESVKSPFTFPDLYRGSFAESHRGSLQSYSSITSYTHKRRSSPVPMNFIPGETKPITQRQGRYAGVPFHGIEKATFCYKGITCQVDRNKPRTSKAIVHMGMLVISMLGPTAHQCAH